MANDVTKVAVGKPKATGGAYTSPLGTALPTDESTALNAAFDLVGFVADTGLVQRMGTNTTDVFAWGGNKVRAIQTSHDLTYELTMIETNQTSQEVFYGANNVTITAAGVSTGQKIAISVTADELPQASWAFELNDGARTGRVVVPIGQVTSRGDVSYVDSGVVSYPVTLSAYPDANGVKAFIFWDDGVPTG